MTRRPAAALLLALLAAACAPRGVTPKDVVRADSADQVIDSLDFRRVTADGRTSVQVQAVRGWEYRGRQAMDLDSLTLTFRDRSGAVSSVVTGRRGAYDQRSGAFDVRGQVVVRATADRRVLKTEHLVYDKEADRIYSDTAYTFTSAKGSGSGASFSADPDFKVLESYRTRARDGGRGFVIPNQRTGP